jgi:hypothetical protein
VLFLYGSWSRQTNVGMPLLRSGHCQDGYLFLNISQEDAVGDGCFDRSFQEKFSGILGHHLQHLYS